MFFSRSDNWFDIYKTVECLESRFGGEHKFRQFGWVRGENIGLLKRSANCWRHARPTGTPPERPMPLAEARERLGRIIRGALDEVQRETEAHRA